jgi:Uma2 family endonuclease
MTTVVKIGPEDHGRPMSRAEIERSEYEEGYRYEIIDGRLYVSPQPDLPENVVEEWINEQLKRYSRRRPKVINYVSSKARVFVPGHLATTAPEPDQAAFWNFPLHLPVRKMRWQDVSPVLVVEILHRDDPAKDLVRNVALYFQVPAIKEYWVIDARDDPDRPTMLVHRRHGMSWRVIPVAFGEKYTTRLLPRLELILDPRR